MSRKSSPSNLISLIPTILSISSVLFMVGLLALFLMASKNQTDIIKETFEINVALTDSATQEDALKLKSQWEKSDFVKNIVFKDKDVEAKKFENEIGQEFLAVIDNPLPHILVLRLHANFSDKIKLTDFEAQLKESALVSTVDYQTGLLENINRNVRKLALILISITILFTLISIALINSTIRLSLFAKRFIIKSMQYVGATDWFIMRPFLRQFFFYGFISSIIAIGALGAIVYGLKKYSISISELIEINSFLIIAATLLVIGCVLIWFSTAFAVKRYLRLQSNQLN
ncbi:permease-like cell division protein FtsX [Bacteroidia bacterium]|nr:permease-like cell division protein FtsX [Bacteroidia bacterium]